MNPTELRKRAGEAVARANDLQTRISEASEASTEDQTNLDAAIAEAEGLFAKAEEAEARAAKIADLQARAQSPVDRIGQPIQTRDGKHEYDVFKAISEFYAQRRGEGQLTGIEAEVHQELRSKRPNSGGLLIPYSAKVATRNLDMSTAAGAIGTAVRLPIIDVLRNRLVLVQAGASLINADGPFKLPKASAATAYWGAGAPTASTPNLSAVTFTPLQVGARTKIDRGALKYSSVDIQGYTINALMGVVADAIQGAAFHGTGSGDDMPLGVFGYTSTDVNVTVMGTNGAALTRANLLSLVAGVDTSNASDQTKAFITSTKVGNKLEATLLESSGTFPKYCLDPVAKTIVGRPYFLTNSVKDNLTKGTSTGVCSAIAYAAWSEMALSLFGGGFEIYLDDVSGQDGSVSVSVLCDADVQLMHGKAFSIATDVLAS